MTPRDDHHREMPEHLLLDDAAAEALLAGRPVPDPDLAPVAAFIGELRSSAQEAPPPPSPALAAVLAGGPVGAEVADAALAAGRRSARPAGPRLTPPRRLPNLRSRLVTRVAAAGLAAKVALGTGVAAAGMTGAAAAGVLPGPAQDVVAGVVSAVSPFELPRHAADDRTGHQPRESGSTDPIEAVPGDRPGPHPDAPNPAEQPGSSDTPGTPAGGLDDGPDPSGGGSGTTVPPGEPRPDTPGPDTDRTTPVDPPADQPDGAPSSTPDSGPGAPEAAPSPKDTAGTPESVPTDNHDSGVPSEGSAGDAPEDPSATPPTSFPSQRP